MRQWKQLLAVGVLALAAACRPVPPAASALLAVETAAVTAGAPAPASAIPTLSPRVEPPTTAASGAPEAAPTLLPEQATPAASTQAAITQQASCTEAVCTYSGLLFLQKPIRPPSNDQLDVSYRFGSTQGGIHDPHHGVEFLNAYGTPVYAAADGKVIVAGADMDPTSARGVWPITFYGPYSNFYGNLVVIEHPAPSGSPPPPEGMPAPLYTLYGHLSEVGVQVGQDVQAGDEIGKVGQAGIATGPHLHFEVRQGENNYKASRNPELWLAENAADGQPAGAIAGRFLDSFENYVDMPSIVIEHLPDGPQGPPGLRVTVMTYEENLLSGQLPWRESFAVGSLPAGWYRLSFPLGGLRQELVQVLPGRLTVVTFRQ